MARADPRLACSRSRDRVIRIIGEAMTPRRVLELFLAFAAGLTVAGVIAWYFSIPMTDAARAVLGTLGAALAAQGFVLRRIG